jgi:hypothetical protein
VSRVSFHRPFQEPLVPLSVKLPPDLVRWLDEQARARKVTRTKLVHDHLRAQQQIHEQLARSFTLGEADGEGTGKQILHATLARYTESIARSIDRLTEHLRGQQWMLNGLAAGLLSPERYKQWQERVRDKLPKEQA